MTDSTHAGGVAMAGGQRYQAQATVWWAARILLQTTTVGEPFDLSPIAITERIYCETTDSIDDIRIELNDSSQIFGQCKRSLTLSSRVGSIWASVLIQFYQELERTNAERKRRFVLFYERPNRNLARLGTVLDRYRLQASGTSLIEVATNKPERTLVNKLDALLSALQVEPAYREELLRHTFIHQLQFSAGDGSYLRVVDALQENLLTNPAQAWAVLNSLHRFADDLIPERGSVDRLILRRRLQGQGIVLRDSINYRTDFERLANFSNTEITNHEIQGRDSLTTPNRKISISRPVIQTMFSAAKTTSFLVVGDAGTGKTGCLLTLAKQLQTDYRVWYWAADALAYPSLEEIGGHLHLTHRWEDLFVDAASGTGAVLILDGLDGLRDTNAQRAYRKLLALAIHCGIKVIASIRAFDLEYSPDLRDLFPVNGQPISSQFLSDNFKKVCHVLIPELDENELSQVVAQFPQVQTVLNIAPQLENVIRNPFSLNLLCDLITAGEPSSQFSAISTQAELFGLYWDKRIHNHELREEIGNALSNLIERMVEQRTLQVLRGHWATELQTALFSAGLVRHPPPISGRSPNEHLVEFNHHLLFDYAAERLFVRPRRINLASELSSPDTWGLFLRPSIVLFHRYMWTYRDDFWETLIELEVSNVPILQKLSAYLVIAEETGNREDLMPLLKGSLSNNDDKDLWISVTQQVVATAAFSSLPKLFKEASGEWWIEFARDLIYTKEPQLVYAGRRLLFSAGEVLNDLSGHGRLFLNQSAVALIKFHWSESAQPNPVIRSAIRWMCSTISSDPSTSTEIIRKIIATDELQRAGYIQALDVADHIEPIWKVNQSLAVEVYDAIFGYTELDRSMTPFVNSSILPMRSNRMQDYDLAYHVLSEKFSTLLSGYPREATQILIRVLRHYREREDPNVKNTSVETFIWNDTECRLQADYLDTWEKGPKSKMLQAWKEYLVNLPTEDEFEEKWSAISTVLADENEIATIWKSILFAASDIPEFYTQHLWTILLNPIILIGSNTRGAAKTCLKAFMPYLSDVMIEKIEIVILMVLVEMWKQFEQAGIAAVEQHLSREIQLLSYIPEEKRSSSANKFLVSLDQDTMDRLRKDTEQQEIVKEAQVEVLADVISRHPNHQALQEKSEFLSQLSSDDITDDNLEKIVEDIRNVQRELLESYNHIDHTFALMIQEKVTKGFVQIAASQVNLGQQLINELYEHFKKFLTHPSDPPSREHLEQFDRLQSWELPKPKINAVEGFIYLAKKIEPLPSEWQTVLHTVAEDSDPVIRHHLGLRIWSFLDKWPEFVWETLESWIKELPTLPGTSGVLRGTLRTGWFWRLRNKDESRANQLLKDLFTAARSSGSSDLRKDCGSWIFGLHFSRDEAWVGNILDELVQSVKDGSDELEGALQVAVGELLPREPKEPLLVDQCQRIQAFLVQVLNGAKKSFEAYESEIANLSPTDRPAEPPLWVKQVVMFFDIIAREFQFSVEQQKKQWITVPPNEKELQITTWWESIDPVLDALLVWPLPHALYSLVKGFDHLIDVDVKRSLSWIKKITIVGVPAGLANESLAADQIIGMLERILADYKASLASEDELRADFFEILEAYLQVGWPRAIQLAIRLESIFR